MKVEFLTHAALRITSDDLNFVCDPWLLNEPVYNFSTWKFPKAIVDPQEVAGSCNTLFLTHSHEDHFHVPSLDLFSREVKIFLPEYVSHPSLRAYTIELTLRKMGFWNIEKLLPWEKREISPDVYLTVIPCAKNRGHDWENAGFLIEDDNTQILNMNDNVSDIKLCREIKNWWPKIDIGFIQSVGVTMYPGCFHMSEEKMKDEAAKRKISLNEQRRLVNIITPKVVVPFAGDFCWLDEKYAHNNWANRGTPKMFTDFMENEYADKDVEYIIMHPGDSWSKASGYKEGKVKVDWENYLDEIEKLKQEFSPKIKRIREWINSSNADNFEKRTKKRLDTIAIYMSKDYINFSAKFRYDIIGVDNPVFVFKADPINGFSYSYGDEMTEVDQTLYIEPEIWAAILEGKLTMNIIQWVAKAEQHVPYRLDIGRFHFWLEYLVDLNTKNCQVYLDDRILEAGVSAIDYNRGVFNV